VPDDAAQPEPSGVEADRWLEDVPEASVEEVERLITAADAIRTAVERVVRSGSTGS
jgi:hypothetical protein